MKTTVVCLGLLLIWAAPVSVSLASDVKFQASLVVSNQPRQDIKVYFNYSTPAIDGQDIYYIADYARNLYRYRNGTSSIIVSNFDARAPQITGFNDVHADQGVVLFAASKVANYAPGAHPIDAYYSLANGKFHRLISTSSWMNWLSSRAQTSMQPDRMSLRWQASFIIWSPPRSGRRGCARPRWPVCAAHVR